MNTTLPVYKMKISDSDAGPEQITTISLVDFPAVEKNFLVFSEHKNFSVENEQERILTGVAMMPNTPIYRRDGNGEYYVVFDAATVKTAAIRFFKNGWQKNMNKQHVAGDLVLDSVYFESWIVEKEKGKKAPPAFSDVPDGTWIVSAKINDPETWAKVLDGTFRGFSIEGFFEFLPVIEVDPEQALVDQITDLLKEVDWEN